MLLQVAHRTGPWEDKLLSVSQAVKFESLRRAEKLADPEDDRPFADAAEMAAMALARFAAEDSPTPATHAILTELKAGRCARHSI